MTLKEYKAHTGEWFAGRKAKTLRTLRNKLTQIEAGTVLEIGRKFNGFSLRTETCKHCGVSVLITGVSFQDIELVASQAPPGAERV